MNTKQIETLIDSKFQQKEDENFMNFMFFIFILCAIGFGILIGVLIL